MLPPVCQIVKLNRLIAGQSFEILTFVNSNLQYKSFKILMFVNSNLQYKSDKILT